MKTVFEKSKPGNTAFSLPPLDVPAYQLPASFLRQTLAQLPEISEPEVVQHYVELSRKNFGIDNGFYPLGSCTMKYNPKINDECAALTGFTTIHPLSPGRLSQGALSLLHNLEQHLSLLTGFHRFSLQPLAGAQAEFTALLIAKAFFRARGECERTKVLIPDVAHGTNPASAAMAGFEAYTIRTSEGTIDLQSLRSSLDERVACIMVTNPNTLGIFEKDIGEINELVHKAGGLSYLDGANFNAFIGTYLPAEQGFDLMHLNLHKTFSTPHGGGGPGAGALGVVKKLAPFLPIPVLEQRRGKYVLDFDREKSIGKVAGFFGNFLVLLRAYAYILTLGNRAHEVSETAIQNAYELKQALCPPYEVPYEKGCMHEFVISCAKIKKDTGIKAIDIAKRLMDFGFHPPTMYFPLTVEEALMIEPTETVDKDTLDAFAAAMRKIYKECYENPELLKSAPHSASIARVDETKAARLLKLRE